MRNETDCIKWICNWIWSTAGRDTDSAPWVPIVAIGTASIGCSDSTRRPHPHNDARVQANKGQHRTLDVTPTRPWSLSLMVYQFTVTSQPSMLYSLLVYVICDVTCDVTCDVGGKASLKEYPYVYAFLFSRDSQYFLSKLKTKS